jgi:uncharacterized Zn finger protein
MTTRNERWSDEGRGLEKKLQVGKSYVRNGHLISMKI